MSTPRVAVVTGASSGIGAGLVEAYRKSGYSVVATSRSITPHDDPGIVTVRGDIAERGTAEHVVAAALENFGRIDTLVNNAGVFMAKRFTDYSLDDFRTMMGTNLFGFFHMTQLALPELVRSGDGHIVNVSCTLAENADARVPSVLTSVTKGGLSAATRSLAIEHARQGVRVNAVSPGVIDTPMHDPSARDALAHMQPLDRIGNISDIVDAVLYLEGAAFVTGEILHVDGGQIAGH
ncbi:SDR family NAD(P)-dependent oxidoreductase [Streptomyces sp. NPDC090075]|uniref:SDR family NAD(P)-dependent oxidoreductase n=1 Tax=Streptomyces sp. NPDC090075 TaxID=3365937 RepID=UPI0038106BE1